MYYQKDLQRLRKKFSGVENIKENYSQSMQDIFVLTMLNGKRNGVYIEIGADQPVLVNNSYLLETEYDWSGVSFEIDDEKIDYFNSIRKNKCICTDAT